MKNRGLSGSMIAGRGRIARATLLAGVAALLAAPAVAQDAAQGQGDPATAGDAIVVTGSRIARPTFDSPVPVTTLTIADLTRGGEVVIGDALERRVPALIASTTQAGSARAGSAIGTSGLNILNLRNLGAARTLVLVDGQRHITSNEGEFQVDVNTIPTGLIDRVDVVTGGSSAVYGSDAMAGVVNFVLKQHFEGFAANAQGGMSAHGDRGTYRLSATYGHNFAEGRGNVALDLEYDRANPVYLADRDSLTGAFSGINRFQLVSGQSAERVFLGGIHSYGFSDGGTFIPYGGFSPFQCDGVAAACRANGFPRVFRFQADGTLAEANYGTDLRPAGSYYNQGGDGSTLKNTGVLTPGYQRFVANLIAHYDVSDAFRPYVEAKFVRAQSYETYLSTFSQGGPQTTDPIYDGTGSLIYAPVGLDNPFLTSQARALISSLLPAGSSYFNVNRYNVDLGVRGERDRRDTFRIVGGAKGTFNDDWHYDVAVNYGHLRTRDAFLNNRIESRFYKAIDAVRNAAGQIVCRVNQVAVTDPACVPLSLLGANGGIQDPAQRAAALAYVNTTSHRNGHASELDVNANLEGNTGRFLTLPGGPIRFALGGEYRRETAYYAFDSLVQSGDTFMSPIGTFAPPVYSVKEAYAEVDLPLLKDLPFVRELSLSGAGRVADYRGSTGTVWAYNGGAVYAPVSDVRFRANFSHSVRAPTLGDLYTTIGPDFAGVDDPCDPNFINSGSPTRVANCRAAGVPANFTAPQTRASYLSILSGGNPNLKAETSRSWTYGVVLAPRAVPGLAITVDYYDIKIRNVIAPVDAQTLLNDCYDAPDLNNVFCSAIRPRNADGTFQLPALLQSTLNYAAQRAKGIDLDIAYNRRLTANDSVAFRFVGNWVRELNYYNNGLAPSEPDRIKGELGNPIYSFNASLDYHHKALTIGYSLRYIGRQSVADWEVQHAVGGVAGTPYDPAYVSTVYYPAVTYHDVRISYDVNPHFTIYGGVDNIGDKMPPYGLLGNGGQGLSSELTSNDSLYDNVGRYLYAGVRVHF